MLDLENGGVADFVRGARLLDDHLDRGLTGLVEQELGEFGLRRVLF